MICFPLDNVEYEANALGAWCGTRTRGVFAAAGHYDVTPGDNMTVMVSPGLAWLKADDYWGVNAFEENAQVLTIDTADGALARIDTVCIRLDKNLNRGELIIKKGAYTPQPPTVAEPVRNIDYDEIYVATILVKAGATTILASDISDQRLNEEYCGIMRDGVTGIPTQQLYDQWASWMANLNSEAQQSYSTFLSVLAEYEQNVDQAYIDYYSRITGFEQQAMAEFNQWFATIQDVLDENTAGNLYNLISGLTARVETLEAIVDYVLIGQFSLPVDAWQSEIFNDYKHYADIEHPDILTEHHGDVVFDMISKPIAMRARIGDPAEVLDGRIRLRSKLIPTVELTGEFACLGANGNDGSPGGGSDYVLPMATATTLGGVKVPDDAITNDGTLTGKPGEEYMATDEETEAMLKEVWPEDDMEG